MCCLQIVVRYYHQESSVGGLNIVEAARLSGSLYFIMWSLLLMLLCRYGKFASEAVGGDNGNFAIFGCALATEIVVVWMG